MFESMKHYKPEDSEGDSARTDTTSSARIKALKEMTRALLHEVESLKDGQQPDERRSVNFSDEVRRFETDLIRWALLRTGGHQRRAARLLSIKVTTLNSKIKRYGIQPAMLSSNVVDLYPEGRKGA
ncbi:MAG TPA: helix-turn-helix domain-containing protein [Pyrinomonadaceae bacterium]|jgi:DNA-binding NtrC family response regulator|nr:helix-turn-helix domain-containing protein [Pyrinomonadaceae bacterium]